MKRLLFIFGVFLLFAAAGCASAKDSRDLRLQEYEMTGNPREGQGQPMGAGSYTGGAGQSQWPGDTVDNFAGNGTGVTGGAAVGYDPGIGVDGNSPSGNNATAPSGPSGNAVNAGAEDIAAGNGIVLLNIKNPVSRGGTGFLSIQGKPGNGYTISAVYKKSGKTFTSAVDKTAGSDGIVSWVWNVSGDTEPGIYNVTVTGGGDVLTTVYTVE